MKMDSKDKKKMKMGKVMSGMNGMERGFRKLEMVSPRDIASRPERNTPKPMGGKSS